MASVSFLKSTLLVSVQFVCIGIIVLTGPIIVSMSWLMALELAGVVMGLWALHTMSIKNLHIFPDVHEKSVLVTHGPYQIIRHPMYTALLLCTLAMVLNESSTLRLAVWVCLGVVLIVKLTYEESLLVQRFQEYTSYQEKTSRLIPYVF